MKKVTVLASLILASGLAAGAGAAEKSTETPRLVVQDLVPGGPAEAIGIKAGDELVRYGGMPAHTVQELVKLRAEATTDSVDVTVLREGELVTFRMAVGQMGVYLKELLPEIEYREDATVIEAIPRLDWSTQKYNSFLAAVELVANHMGIDRDYVYLNGVSGAAFRLHFFKSWCPSSPDPTCGYNSGEDALRAVGLDFDLVEVEEEDTSGRHQLKQEMIASLDEGVPVIGIDLVQVPEWGIVTGYQGGGDEFLCRDYFARRQGYDIVEKLPWAAYLISGKKEMPADVDNYRKSFKIVSENLTTPSYGEYASGLAAFDEWIENLGSEHLMSMDSASYEEACHANAWIYDRLIHDREMGVEYLKRVAHEMPELADRLKTLEQLYREEIGALGSSDEVVVYGFSLKARDDWSEEMRREAAARLKKAKTKEEAALPIWQEMAGLISKVRR